MPTPSAQRAALLRVLKAASASPAVLDSFLEDLLTPQEYEDFALRWQIIQLLHQGVPQREIAKRLKVSISKITRGSRELLDPQGGFNRLLKQHSK